MQFETSDAVLAWWALLCAVSAVNVGAWLLAARAMRLRVRRGDAQVLHAWPVRQLQLGLSAAYVLGCAYRSASPVFDVQRLCLFDHWLASVAVGRSVATLAELCFVLQWALLLRVASQGTGHPRAARIGAWLSALMVALIGIAEVCSWYAVLSTSNLGHVAEESLWAVSATLFVLGLMAIWPRCERALRPLLTAGIVAGLAYVAYLAWVDVPMYWARWVSDEAAGRHYLGLAAGLADVSAHWVVSHRWADWRSEVVWMTLYFSVAVWLSIGLAHVPLPMPLPMRRALALAPASASPRDRRGSGARPAGRAAHQRQVRA
ncbi:MAG: hypothetical protein AB9M60_00555 [Leptothrix sp. (in: b-proteobacteria)]